VVSTGGTLGRKRSCRQRCNGRRACAGRRRHPARQTNTPEFTLGGAGRGTVNRQHGLTRNPYDVSYQPSGSSGVTGAIVAAAGSPFDIGSQYGGSIRGPTSPTARRDQADAWPQPARDTSIGYGWAVRRLQETVRSPRRVEDLAPAVADPLWSRRIKCRDGAGSPSTIPQASTSGACASPSTPATA
jgi:amidase